MEFEKTVEKFVKRIRFSQKFIDKFEKIIIEEWEKRRNSVQNDSIEAGKRVTRLQEEQVLIKDKIKQVSNLTAIRLLEADLEEIETKISEAIRMRDTKEDNTVEIQTLLNRCKFYMEHFEELLLRCPNPAIKGRFFSLIFEEMPTYQMLIDGTPNLAPIFALNEDFKSSKSLSVSPEGFEPSANCLRGNCSTAELRAQKSIVIVYDYASGGNRTPISSSDPLAKAYAPLRGIEPLSPVPKTGTLSVELQGLQRARDYCFIR